MHSLRDWSFQTAGGKPSIIMPWIQRRWLFPRFDQIDGLIKLIKTAARIVSLCHNSLPGPPRDDLCLTRFAVSDYDSQSCFSSSPGRASHLPIVIAPRLDTTSRSGPMKKWGRCLALAVAFACADT